MILQDLALDLHKLRRVVKGVDGSELAGVRCGREEIILELRQGGRGPGNSDAGPM